MLCAVVEDEGVVIPDDQDVEVQVGKLAGFLAAAEDEVLIATDGGAYLAGEHYKMEGGLMGRGRGRRDRLWPGDGRRDRLQASARLLQCCARRFCLLTGRRVRVLLDNLAIVQGTRRRASADFVADELWEFWQGYRQVRDLMQFAWIPSHGKLACWTSPCGWPEAGFCRRLNAAAVAPWFRSLERRIQEGEAWCYKALNAQLAATEPWHLELKKVMADKKAMTWRAKRAVA